METPKATNKTAPESSPGNPSCNKDSSDAQIAAQKLDDIIEGQRKDSSGRRMERQQSRRITSISSRRNLMAASPSMTFQTRSEAVLQRIPSRFGDTGNPPSADSSTGSENDKKGPSGKTAENLQRDLEAKARARGLRSSPSVRNMGASAPSVRKVMGVKKAPPPSLPSKESSPSPRRQLSLGDSQPSRIPHFSPSRLNGADPSRLEDSTSSFEVQMGGVKGVSHTAKDSTTASSTGTSEEMKRPGLLSQSKSVGRFAAQSFRRDNFARESSMSVLRRSATTSNNNPRDLDQLIAYKTGISLQEDGEDAETKKPSAVVEGPDICGEDGLVSPPPCPPYAAAPPRPTTGSSFSGLTNNRDLDELIAYKTGIPLQDSSSGEDVEQHVEQVSHDVEKGQLIKNGGYTSSQVAKRPALGPDAVAPPEGKGGKYDPEDAGMESNWTDDIAQEDLAIAIEVQEEDEDAFIPSAIEYDPEAKPPIYKHRRFRFYCAFLFAMAIVAIAGVVAIVQSQPEAPPQADLPDGGEPTEAQSIMSIIELVVGEEKLADIDGPHYAALDWITNVDKWQVGVTDTSHLVQRYVLALFHFQTWHWLEGCGSTDKVTNYTFGEDEHECLYQQLQSILPQKYRPVPSYRWLSKVHECEWAGIRCDEDGNVRVIDLQGQYIRGKLPKEFKELRFLQSLMFSWNELSGTIPEEYGNMQYLASFELSFNQLTGTLPTWTGTRNLQLFNVGSNALSGTIPSSINTMANLGGLYLFDNSIRGQIPEEIGDVSTLKFIRFNKNFLTGTLPTTIGRLNPSELGLSRLELTGPIPSEIGNIVGLKTLRLQSTPFNGTIPEELFNLTNLKRVEMYDSNLSGTLSTNIGKLTNLQELRINDNRFTGPLPSELGNLPLLDDLWVHGNQFEGAVPLQVCSLKQVASLKAVHADCLAANSTGVAQNACDCCDTCCNPESKICISAEEQEGVE